MRGDGRCLFFAAMGYHTNRTVEQIKEACRRTAETRWEEAAPYLGAQERRSVLRNLRKENEYGSVEHMIAH